MTTEIYITISIAALIGLTFQVLVKMGSLFYKKQKLNVTYTLRMYFKDDKWALLANVVSSFAIVFVISEWLDLDGKVASKIKSIFVFVGYAGSEGMMRLLSVASKRLNSAMDYKSTEGDIKNDTVNTPTPALLPHEIEKLKQEEQK